MKVKEKALYAVKTSTALVIATAILMTASLTVVGAQSSRKAEIQEKIQEKRQQVIQQQEERKQNSEEKSEERRLQACERNADRAEKIMSNVSSKAERYYAVVNAFQEKVEAFYDKGQLTVSNYDELHAVVEEKQVAARESVDALESLGVEIDCSSEDVAVDVGVYRELATGTKTVLQEYRRSLVDLVSSMRSAAAEGTVEDSDTSDDDSSDDSESEVESESENEQENEQESQDPTETEQQEVEQ